MHCSSLHSHIPCKRIHGLAWDGDVVGVNTGGSVGVGNQSSDGRANSWGGIGKWGGISQPWLSLGVSLTLPETPAWDGDIGGVDTGSRLGSSNSIGAHTSKA